ncbi:endolysin glycoside hydrolase [Brachyspira pilosicoli P43/6/78]|uniref:Endolysin glycoside hydrolase n=1 Tax=Brachyspira pilosicoli P43/6/78 TaxID=1042417 RepID=A0A3B6VPU2_BRAPL|nr:glycoside hydrolase family 19 protein [Brachyspira pilosicoli]AGA66994.1 endolysin glycoside hydrolase [Brachyspira pilosicoli P43/6/78]
MIDIKKYLSALNIDSSWESILKKYLLAYNITKEKDIKMFLAQTSHESLSYKRLEESFKYRPEVLIKVFPKYFKTLEEAKDILYRGDEALANRVYGGRLGNNFDEGYKYRGRGIIQLTGKSNYIYYGKLLNIDLVNNPDWLLERNVAVNVACCYWINRGLLSIDDIRKATKKINGGYNGLEDRIKRYKKIENL